MLGKIEGRRRRGQQRMRWLDGIINFDGHGFGWTLGVGDGQGGLVCRGSWGHNESDRTERLNWTELKGNQTSQVNVFSTSLCTGRFWAHWNHSFDVHLNYLGPVSSFSPSWTSSGYVVGGAEFGLMRTASFDYGYGRWHFSPTEAFLWTSCYHLKSGISNIRYDSYLKTSVKDQNHTCYNAKHPRVS